MRRRRNERIIGLSIIALIAAIAITSIAIIIAVSDNDGPRPNLETNNQQNADNNAEPDNDENEEGSSGDEQEPNGEEGTGDENEDAGNDNDDGKEDDSQQVTGGKTPEMFYTENGYLVSDPENTRGLSEERIGFSFGVASNGQVHYVSRDLQAKFDSMTDMQALVYDNRTTEKVIYLTYDCGYEYEENTAKTLDILKEKNVPAAFFLLIQFPKQEPEVTKRMIDEGHIIGNHTANHPAMYDMTRTEMAADIYEFDKYMLDHFDYRCEYFRFPSGEYSENALDLCNSIGFKTIFWSLAYADWDPADPMEPSKALETLKSRLHPGAVILLHAVSGTNVEILPEFIDYARENGYEFRSLDDYPW